MTEEEKKKLINPEEASKSQDTNDNGSVSDVLEKLPPDAKRVVEIGMSMQRFGPMPNPLADKLTEGHIDKILDHSSKSDERAFEDAKASRKYALIYVTIFVTLFMSLTVFLVLADKALYEETLKLFIAFIGGFGGGYGVKSYMDRHK
jgi:hypothetical protein